MSRLPIPHIINTIKTKLGFDRTMTASGEDVVDAVNKQSQQIDDLGPYNGLDSDSTTAALSAAQGKVLNDKISVIGTGLTLTSTTKEYVTGDNIVLQHRLAKGRYLLTANAYTYQSSAIQRAVFQIRSATGVDFLRMHDSSVPSGYFACNGCCYVDISVDDTICNLVLYVNTNTTFGSFKAIFSAIKLQ